MKRFLLVSVIFLFMVFAIPAQNVGINDDNSAAKASAMLDVNSTTKGMLIPRIALTSTATAAPVTSPEVSLLIYNTATAGTAPNNVIPGYYFWNGTIWVGLSSDSYFKAPYGTYYDLTDQYSTNTTTAYPVTFSNNDVQYGFTHTAGTSAITATYAGIYLITFSGVFQGPSGTVFNVWLRVNGSNYANSNTNFSLVANAQNRVVTVTYIVTLSAGQYFELMMQSTSSTGRLDFTDVQTSPARPACPSIIITVNKISN